MNAAQAILLAVSAAERAAQVRAAAGINSCSRPARHCGPEPG
jgi:hypothetical protein